MKKNLFILVLVFGAAVITQLLFSMGVSAADARDFNAGKIIDDAVFTNTGSMTVDDIQRFIESKVTCDTWGSKRSELGGGTRAQWMNSRGIYAPFRCLADYRENVSNGQNNYGKNNAPDGSISAAQIIYNYSLQFGINPQVIIATLQKENALVTDEWPTPKQFSEAMGFGCPDNVAPGAPACDASYGSFAAQVYQAARHFRGFFDNKAGWYVPFSTGNNFVRWSPTASCGGANVWIENRATVALYSYTPYQPNQAAKNAQYGSGDGCSAYGNRNFFMYFSDWFGSTYGSVQLTSPLRVTSNIPAGNFTSREMTFSFTIKNNSAARQNVGDLMIAARDASGGNHDFGRRTVTLGPGETYEYIQRYTFNTESDYTFSIANYREGNGWSDAYPVSANSSLIRSLTTYIQALPSVTKAPGFDDTISRQGRLTPVSFTIRNNSSRPLQIGKVGLAVRGPQSQNYDLAFNTVGQINAGATYTYMGSIKPAVQGQYTLSISTTKDDRSWTGENFFTNNSLSSTAKVDVKPGVVISEGLGADSEYKELQKVTQSYTLTNYTDNPVTIDKVGVFIRSPRGENYDPRWDTVTINPRSSYVYSVDTYPPVAGEWKVEIGGLKNGEWTNDLFPSEGVGLRSKSIMVRSNPVVTEGITYDTQTVRSGKVTTVSFKVFNDGDIAVKPELLGVSIRGQDGSNLDPGWESPTIQPRTTYVYSKQVTFPRDGKFTIAIGGKKEGNWVANPIVLNAGISSTREVQVQPGVTLTQGVTLTGSPTVGSRQLSLKITNFTNSRVNLGKIGIAVRDPDGRNYDHLWEDFIIEPNSDKVHTVTIPFDKSGVWTAEIGNFNGTWNAVNPASENADIKRQLKITIL